MRKATMKAPRLSAMVFVLVAFSIVDSRAQSPGDSKPAAGAAALQTPTPAAVDQLIPWLLDEDRQLRGIPFSEVIVAVTGMKALAFDPQNEIDRRVIKQIGAALDAVTRRMNASDSPIQNIARINEVSSHFEDM